MKNIVLITIDSVCADHCGFMGYHRDTTPTLDRMADKGVVFENAIAPGSKTPESMPAIFTSEYPLHETKKSELAEWREYIRPHMDTRTTIPELFTQLGYRTLGFTTNGFTSKYFGFDKGFDYFEDFSDHEWRPGLAVPSVIRGAIKMLRQEESFKPWEAYYDTVLETLHSGDKPYFLWVFLMDAHVPYFVPKQYRSDNSLWKMIYVNWRRGDSEKVHNELVSAYDDSIRYVDEFLRRLQRDLSSSDPAIVVHADHGEAFGEHGRYGHGELLYEENIRVPLVVANVDERAAIPQQMSLRRLPELLLQISQGSGTNVSSYVANNISNSIVVSRTVADHRISIRSSNYKFIEEKAGGTQLYNLQNDPEERRNIAGTNEQLESSFRDIIRQIDSSVSEKRTIRDSAIAIA